MYERRLVGLQSLHRFLLRRTARRTIRRCLKPILQDRNSFLLRPPAEDLPARIAVALPWIRDPTIEVLRHRYIQPSGTTHLTNHLVYRYGRTLAGNPTLLSLRREVPAIVDGIIRDYHGLSLPAPLPFREITIAVLCFLAETALADSPDPHLEELARLASDGNEVLFLSNDERTVFVRCGDTRSLVRERTERTVRICLAEPAPS